ncbi:MucBP domain-containing protein [Streptococcus ruminantium]|uniref:MucBP domain-containing protein n=1 Tax=Streptococcus ruminantium TaxID=1917441 RepID=UPI0012DD7233|nr:YSIRK-type signal peptide-containing protein [Streptococcus ruminantium]
MYSNSEKKENGTKQSRFSIRKFSAGVVSVTIAAFWMTGPLASADTQPAAENSTSLEEIATEKGKVTVKYWGFHNGDHNPLEGKNESGQIVKAEETLEGKVGETYNLKNKRHSKITDKNDVEWIFDSADGKEEGKFESSKPPVVDYYYTKSFKDGSVIVKHVDVDGKLLGSEIAVSKMEKGAAYDVSSKKLPEFIKDNRSYIPVSKGQYAVGEVGDEGNLVKAKDPKYIGLDPAKGNIILGERTVTFVYKFDKELLTPSKPLDDLSKKKYSIYHGIDGRTEGPKTFEGTAAALEEFLKQEMASRKDYPYVDRFEKDERVLLVFNKYKTFIVIQTKEGDEVKQTIYPSYKDPEKLTAEIKQLMDGFRNDYHVERKDGFDKNETNVPTVTLVLTKKSEKTKREQLVQPKAEQPSQPKVEQLSQPKVEQPSQPKVEQLSQPKAEQLSQPKGEQSAQAKAEKLVPSKGRMLDSKQTEQSERTQSNPQIKREAKTLPNTGEGSSALMLVGVGLGLLSSALVLFNRRRRED